MTERGENTLSSQLEGWVSGERPGSFIDELEELIRGKKRVDEQGKTITEEAVVRHPYLRRIVSRSFLPQFQTPEKLEENATQVAKWLDEQERRLNEDQITEGDFVDLQEQGLALEAVLMREWWKRMRMAGEEGGMQTEGKEKEIGRKGQTKKRKTEEEIERRQAEINRLHLEGNEEEARKAERKLEEELNEDILPEIFGNRGESPPNIDEIGPERYEHWFNKRLYALLEENRGQGFDTNWYLIYPLNRAIERLPLADRRIIFNGEETEITYSALRRELSKKLSAFRNIHNYNYFHDRVPGTPGLIEASHLLKVSTIDYLLRYEDSESGEKIADRLRELEELAEKGNKEEIVERLRNSSQWSTLVAGYLFKGLEEAARYDLNTGAAGDFFLGRIFHSRERALGDWESKWGRDPGFTEIPDACDLEIYSFWPTILDIKRKRLEEEYGKGEKASDEFLRFCRKMGILNKEGKEVEKEDIESKAKLATCRLSSMRFEELDLESFLPENQLLQGRLDDDDAENVRKLLLNPGGLLQRPTLSILGRINEVFKHLKGEERYRWFRRMATAIINYYKDNNYPFWDNVPEWMRSSRSRKDFPHVVPWTARQIRNSVESMAPFLGKKDMDKVLERTLGKNWKARMTSKDVGVSVVKGAITTIWEILKNIFGL